MIDTKNCLIAWGIITFVFVLLAFVSYMWLSNVSRFENRKKEIALGFTLCALAVSSLMFLPLLFSRIDLQFFGQNLFESIQAAGSVALENGEKLSLVPFVKPFSHFLSATQLKYIRLIIIGVPVLVSLLIIIFTVIILFKIREPKKSTETEYNRKHLFEYNPQIVTELNKKK